MQGGDTQVRKKQGQLEDNIGVQSKRWSWGQNSSLVVFGLAVHSVAGSILLWGNFPV